MDTQSGRIIALDYGLKRVGIAVTDPLQIIVTPLAAISTASLFFFLQDYLGKENVVSFVIGMPIELNGKPSEMSKIVQGIALQLKEKFPTKNFYYEDERFTSKLAMQGLCQAGYSKKERANKSNIDKVSAAIILQSFLKRLERT